MSIPVFTHEERQNYGNQDSKFDNPHCVIHLINKRPYIFTESGISHNYTEEELTQLQESACFSDEDLAKAEMLSYAVARCAEQIYKIEQLHSMVNVTDGLIRATTGVE